MENVENSIFPIPHKYKIGFVFVDGYVETVLKSYGKGVENPVFKATVIHFFGAKPVGFYSFECGFPKTTLFPASFTP